MLNSEIGGMRLQPKQARERESQHEATPSHVSLRLEAPILDVARCLDSSKRCFLSGTALLGYWPVDKLAVYRIVDIVDSAAVGPRSLHMLFRQYTNHPWYIYQAIIGDNATDQNGKFVEITLHEASRVQAHC